MKIFVLYMRNTSFTFIIIFIILLRGFAKMLSCQNKSKTRQQFWHFSISKKAQLSAIRKTEEPMLLTKRKINWPGYKFSKYFR